ncbi:hypothetical protein ATY89_00840 [Sulfolobus acidocaldarius]|uniref:Conserved Archaeal protein n=4 Tax=Sulfolobus acidocaldarius TaxID=2285 RepID=Q4J9Q0_SULAC|nr:conserved Archaeal protein [Sulfolobus acidocaldarius DSM 639]AGE71065.1 hypothetical protein SacN8_05490 [Sulfolobus acidocaldarius N8]ALU30512.1 hypothetical protein ATY89_00840 [Sulfolobus acidocaldarius]ALU32774.1 hypothetical protein ATZ20_03880 [Sulfolobus acidocaldarius]WCM36025.1 DUF87 domain-containing protein [Sulfolobus acidocaldarius DSM 639]
MDSLRSLISKADEKAVNLSSDGKIIGRVTRFSHVKIAEEPAIAIDIPFENYLEKPIERGEFIGIVSIIPGSVVLGAVDQIARADALASLGIRTVRYSEDPSTMITPTTIIFSPLGEIKSNGQISPNVSAIDPQSPVFLPKPDLIEKVINIPSEGLEVGEVTTFSRQTDVRLRLEENILRSHVLLIGTTGSGKTTFLKTIFFSNYKNKKSTIVLDRQGDFVRFLIKQFKEGTVIVPLTVKAMEEYGSFENLVQDRYCGENTWQGDDNSIVCEPEQGRLISFYPFSLRFKDIFRQLPDSFPYLSDYARASWSSVVRACEKLTEVSSTSPSFYKMLESCLGRANINTQTSGNIQRSLSALIEYGILDIPNTITGSELIDLLKSSQNVVIDLSIVLETLFLVEPISVISYNILDIIYNYKDKMYKMRKKGVNDSNDIPQTLLLIDEAHEMFPQISQEVSKATVEKLINKILRFGRQRNLGVILATHSPKDLNSLVIQQTNTKFIFRNDRTVLRDLGLTEFTDLLESAPAGYCLVKSSFFNSSSFFAKVYVLEVK